MGMESQTMTDLNLGNVASEVARHRLLVLGFDLGKQTGVARYIDGKLLALETVQALGHTGAAGGKLPDGRPR